MKLRVIGGFGGELPGCRSTAFLIDDCLAIDAGSLSTGLTLDEQARLRHILISHGHVDHCGSLPYFCENVFDRGGGPVKLHGSRSVVQALREHLFNGAMWPDMASPELPVLELVEVEPGVPFTVGGLRITALAVPHTVPCLAFHIDDGRHALLYSADMAPNDAFWAFANSVERLDAVLLECSFPSRLQELARASMHLTPHDVESELAKLQRPARIFVFHVKPPHRDEVVAELARVGRGRSLQVVEQDRIYLVERGGEGNDGRP